MTPLQTDDDAPVSGARWWVAWAVIAILVIGGGALTLRLAPKLTPVLDSTR